MWEARLDRRLSNYKLPAVEAFVIVLSIPNECHKQKFERKNVFQRGNLSGEHPVGSWRSCKLHVAVMENGLSRFVTVIPRASLQLSMRDAYCSYQGIINSRSKQRVLSCSRGLTDCGSNLLTALAPEKRHKDSCLSFSICYSYRWSNSIASLWVIVRRKPVIFNLKLSVAETGLLLR